MKRCLCLVLGMLLVMLCIPISISAANVTPDIGENALVSAQMGKIVFTMDQPAEEGILDNDSVVLQADGIQIPVAVEYTAGENKFIVRFGELPENAECILTLPSGIMVNGSQTLQFITKPMLHQTVIGPESNKTGNNASASFVEASGDDPAYIQMQGNFAAGGVDFALEAPIGKVAESFYTDLRIRIPSTSTETNCSIGLQIQNGYDINGGASGNWKWPVRYRAWDQDGIKWRLWADKFVSHEAEIDQWQDIRMVFNKNAEGYYQTDWYMKNADQDIYECITKNAETNISYEGIIKLKEMENMYLKMQEGKTGLGIADVAKWEIHWGGTEGLTPYVLKTAVNAQSVDIYMSRSLNENTVVPENIQVNGKTPGSVYYDETERKITVTSDEEIQRVYLSSLIAAADGMPAAEEEILVGAVLGVYSSVASGSEIPATQGQIVLTASDRLDPSTVTEDNVRFTKGDGSPVKGGYGLTILDDGKSLVLEYGDLEENQDYKIVVNNAVMSMDGKQSVGLQVNLKTQTAFHIQDIQSNPGNASTGGQGSISYVQAAGEDPDYLRLQVDFTSIGGSEAYLVSSQTYTKPFYTDFTVRIPDESEEITTNIGFQYKDAIPAGGPNWRWPIRAKSPNGYAWNIYGDGSITTPITGDWQDMRLLFTKNEAGNYRMDWFVKNKGENKYSILAENEKPIPDSDELSGMTNLYLKLGEGKSAKAIADVASWQVYPLGNGGMNPKVIKAAYASEQAVLSVSRDLDESTVNSTNVLAYQGTERIPVQVDYDAENRQIILTGSNITRAKVTAAVLSADGMPFAADPSSLSVKEASIANGASVSPMLGEIDLSINGVLDTQTLTKDTVKLSTANGKPVCGGYVFQYEAASKKLKIQFGELDAGETYRLEVTDGLMSPDGDIMDIYTLNFTTKTPLFSQEIKENPSNYERKGPQEGDLIYTASSASSPAYLRMSTPLYGGQSGNLPDNALTLYKAIDESFYTDLILRVPEESTGNFNIMFQMQNAWAPALDRNVHGWETLMRDQNGYWNLHNAESEDQKYVVTKGKWEYFRILYEKDENGAYQTSLLVQDDNGVYRPKAEKVPFSGDQVGKMENFFLKQQTLGWTTGTAVIDIAKWDMLPLDGALTLAPAVLTAEYAPDMVKVIFTRDMNPASFEGKVSAFNSYGDPLSFSTSYSEADRTLTITGANISSVDLASGIASADGMPFEKATVQKPAEYIVSELGITNGKGGENVLQIAGLTQANGSVSIENNREEAMTVTLIIALYGKDKQLKQFDYQTKTIAGQTKDYLNDAALEAIIPVEGDFIRVYIWNGEITEAVPLAKPVNLPYSI